MAESAPFAWFVMLGVAAAVLILGGFAVLYWYLSRDKEE